MTGEFPVRVENQIRMNEVSLNSGKRWPYEKQVIDISSLVYVLFVCVYGVCVCV